MRDAERQITEELTSRLLGDRPGVVLRRDTELIENDIIDSLGIVDLVGVLEERFGIEIDPEDVVPESFETVSAIAQLVERKLAEAGK